MAETLTREEFENKISPIQKAINRLLGKQKAKNMIVQDANGTDIDFYDKTEGGIEEGDKANVDGSPATGDYVMPDGNTVTFENGEVTNITPVEDEGDEEMSALREELDAVKAENESLKASNKKLSSAQEDQKKQVQAVKNQLEEFKSSMQSSFSVKGEAEQGRRSGDDHAVKTKSRSLFKK